MPNPYAPRVRAPRRTTPNLPTGRMRSVGASVAELDYWRDVYDSLDDDGKRGLVASWESMTDDELAREVRVSLAGVPDGAGEEPAGEDVPDGTIDEVLGWVRAPEDREARRYRARLALDAEREGKGRVGVVDPLKEFLGA